MKLHSPAFEKRLKQDIRRVIKSDPALRKEAKRSRKRVQRQWANMIVRLLFSLVLVVFVLKTFHANRDVDAALMVINLWIFTTTLGFANSLIQLPYQSKHLIALRLLPIAEPVIFRWEFDRFLYGAALCLVDLTAGLGALGWAIHLSPLQWIFTAALVPLTGAFMLCLAMLGAARAPQLPYGFIWGNLYLFWFILFISIKYTGSTVLVFLEQSAPLFNLLVLTGWPLGLFHLLLPGKLWLYGVLIFPVAGIFYTFNDSRRIIRDRFIYREPIFDEAADQIPEENIDEPSPESSAEPPVRRAIGVTAIGEGILSGEFTARADWTRGRLESTLWRWFNEREKTLVEFAFPAGLAILRPWKTIGRNLLITLALGFGAALVIPFLASWIFALGLFIVFAHAIAQTANTGSAFRSLMNGGVVIPVYAAYPISFRELSRMLMKCSLIQMPFFILLTTVTTATLVHFIDQSVARGISSGLKMGILFLGARFFILVFAFSSATGDTSRLRFRSFLMLCFFGAFGCLYLALGGIGLFAPYEVASWLCCFSAVLVTYLFFRIYGWLYNSNKFDLMRAPRQ